MARPSWLMLLALGAAPLGAQQNFDSVQVRAVPVAAGVTMLVGAGGNIAVSSGADGVFVVDDQFAPLAPKIRAAVAAIDPKPIKFVLNTHWHGDHTGGNQAFGEGGALIIAHDNVRQRMSTEQFIARFDQRTPPSPKAALPVVTFATSSTLHFNGDDVEAIHVPRAHTDGDAVIWFHRANVVHMGDTFFNGVYPFIDESTGGTIDGIISAAETMLARIDDQTKIIPGHGALGAKQDLRAYRDAMVTVRDRVRKLKAEGKTVQQVVAAKPTADLDATWGKGFMNGDTFVSIVYATVAAR